MSRLAAALLAASVLLPAGAAAQAVTDSPPQRIREVTLTAGQACPKAEGDEVVVCRTQEDPYRIPKELRNEGPVPAQRSSWVARQQTIDAVSAKAGGLPQQCSPIGAGGYEGCNKKLQDQWAAERRAKAQADRIAAGD